MVFDKWLYGWLWLSDLKFKIFWFCIFFKMGNFFLGWFFDFVDDLWKIFILDFLVEYYVNGVRDNWWEGGVIMCCKGVVGLICWFGYKFYIMLRYVFCIGL